jgi:CHAP domain protein
MVKNKLNKKLGRVGAGLLSALLIAGTYSTKTVYADDNKATTVEKENTLPVIEVSQQDLNPLDTIKSLVIQERAAFDGTYDLTNISIEKSIADIEGFNRSVTGIQTVTVKVTLASTGDIEAQKTLGYSFIQKAVVNVVNSTAPVIKLKNSSVVVNNGDTFNASSYISYINDDSGILPVLTVDGAVDMNTDGDYPVTYTVVDTAGNKSTATMTVSVRTPQEVVDARIAAEEQRQREEAERAAAEEAARAQQAANTARSATTSTFDPSKYDSSLYAGGIAAALSFVGTPYQWGGTTPAGFDCSGLVQYCYGLGARTTYAQQALGTHQYDVWNAPAGALYFYGSDSAPYHVGIALGNGTMVHAATYGIGVTVQDISGYLPSYYVVPGQ